MTFMLLYLSQGSQMWRSLTEPTAEGELCRAVFLFRSSHGHGQAPAHSLLNWSRRSFVRDKLFPCCLFNCRGAGGGNRGLRDPRARARHGPESLVVRASVGI